MRSGGSPLPACRVLLPHPSLHLLLLPPRHPRERPVCRDLPLSGLVLIGAGGFPPFVCAGPGEVAPVVSSSATHRVR